MSWPGPGGDGRRYSGDRNRRRRPDEEKAATWRRWRTRLRAARRRARIDPNSAIDRTAEERLRRSSYLAVGDVACIARHDVVYLHGRLPSYFLKQVAQEIAAGVKGVRRVINRIDVLRPSRLERNGLNEARLREGASRFQHTQDERNPIACWF